MTIKCRLGVDNDDSYEFVKNFIDTVSKQSDVKHFLIHARKAFLKVIPIICSFVYLKHSFNISKGLNPHENRSVPPLHYDWVI